jgi:hypothetical protein
MKRRQFLAGVGAGLILPSFIIPKLERSNRFQVGDLVNWDSEQIDPWNEDVFCKHLTWGPFRIVNVDEDGYELYDLRLEKSLFHIHDKMLEKAELGFWTNDIDYTIATNPGDAQRLLADLYYGKGRWKRRVWDDSIGETEVWGHYKNHKGEWRPIYYEEFLGEGEWHRWADEDKDFTLYNEDTNSKTKLPVREWIRREGYGYFACSEY